MKQILSLALAGVMMLSLAACGGAPAATSEPPAGESTSPAVSAPVEESAAPEQITITSLNASKEEVELEVPYDPQRIAILDMASLDILDALGVAEGRVVGSAGTSLDYLQQYVTDESISNLGTIKEADLEAVMACEPDVIFIGGRLSKSYDALSEIAPVVYLATDTAALITLMPALMRRYQLSRQDMEAIINTPRAAGEFLMPYFYGARNEQAYLLCLDAKGKALACDRIGEGALNSVGLDSRAAVECVLRHRASLAVLAHNHTSGVAAPSREDVSATLELERVLSAVGVELFDHILVADEDFVSFRESGLGPWKLF